MTVAVAAPRVRPVEVTAQRAADHAMGLELQLEELNEQRRRAEVQGRTAELPSFDREIAALQSELALTAEALAATARDTHR
jgi:hypothetical protein